METSWIIYANVFMKLEITCQLAAPGWREPGETGKLQCCDGSGVEYSRCNRKDAKCLEHRMQNVSSACHLCAQSAATSSKRGK